MSTTINPDATRELPIQIRIPRLGSCWTEAQINELTRLLYVQLPDQTQQSNSLTPIGKEIDNLARLDTDLAVYVPAVAAYQDTQQWIAGTTTELVFTGWSSPIDPTSRYCAALIYPIYSPVESGFLVRNAAGSGTVAIRPTLEITSVSSSEIRVKLYQNTSDAAITVRLTQNPLPPQQA